ncbi:hypothetical protein IFM89_011746 [Coptis chinensis]|uniref:DUF632 domain-containing protein n=1 Tax=Coptis chinensis TaxID=261450 RepID=A0A835IYH3_9MAGN|nr:hypothetical protein IFM89_011746 [Coptis chinensis]
MCSSNATSTHPQNIPSMGRGKRCKSSKVFSALSWSWTSRALHSSKDAIDFNEPGEPFKLGAYGITLDKIYAEEEKLYKEVKLMHFSTRNEEVPWLAASIRSRPHQPLLVKSMAAQKPAVSTVTTRPVVSKKESAGTPIKLLTRVEQLKLLTKAEKAGLLSTAEKAGLSLSSIEKLGLLSKAEELGVLSAATDPETPSTLLSLSLGLLVLGPLCAYIVPEDYPWEVVLQVAVALTSIVGGSAALAASNFVSNLQRSA